VVARQLKALTPLKAGKRYFKIPELKRSANTINSIVKKSCDSKAHPILLRLIQNDIEKIINEVGPSKIMFLERQGERDDLILDLTSCISETRLDDEIKGVLALRLLQTNNLGPSGRFMASLATAAKSGVKIELVVLVKRPEDESANFKLLVNDLKKRNCECKGKAGKLEIKLLIYDEKQYEKFALEYGSFLLIQTPDGIVVMDANFERAGGRCTALRFSSQTQFGTDVVAYNSAFNEFFSEGNHLF
jgi:hypothetical protein